MHFLRENFRIFTFCGCWMPASVNSSKCKYTLYNIYSLALLSMLLAMLSMKITNITSTSYHNIQELAVAILGFAEFIFTLTKSITLKVKREKIFNIDKIFLTCRNSNSKQEMNIQDYFDNVCRILAYGFVVVALCCALPLESRFIINNSWDLLLDGYATYKISSATIFWLSYFQQAIVVNISSPINMNFDTIIAGYMLQICAQFDILKLKIMNISRLERYLQYRAIVQCVRRHLMICRLIKMIQDIFNVTFIIQLALTTPVMAIYFYAFVEGKPGDPMHNEFFLAVIYELFQLVFYCWFGSEVTLKSLEVRRVVYESNWLGMYERDKRAMWMIMARATRPIFFTLGKVFTLSTDTFVKLLKFIYTAYNMLLRMT